LWANSLEMNCSPVMKVTGLFLFGGWSVVSLASRGRESAGGCFRSSGFPARVLSSALGMPGDRRCGAERLVVSREAAKGNTEYSYLNSFDCSAAAAIVSGIQVRS